MFHSCIKGEGVDRKKYYNQWRKEHPNYHKQWHKKHPEKNAEYKKRDYKKHREKRLAFSKKYWKEYREGRNPIVRNNYRKRVAYFRESGVCVVCKENHPACLDWHHRDSSLKEFPVCRGISDGFSEEEIWKEIEKCDILCSNCHRKIHWIMRDGMSYEEVLKVLKEEL